MKTKLFTLFYSLLFAISLCAQGWENIAALGIMSGLNAQLGGVVQEVISPYMDCCVGKEVVLIQPDYLYKKYNWKHEEGKGEIDRDMWPQYLNKKYVIKQIGYGAEAGPFQYGVVFELFGEEQTIYAILGYRHIANNDALSTIFKDYIPCPSYYRNFIRSEIDPFTNNKIVFCALQKLSSDNRVFAAVTKSSLEDSMQYRLILHIGSNTIKTEEPICTLVLSNGEKILCQAEKVETSYVDGFYKMYYSANIVLSESEIINLSQTNIQHIRFMGIDIKGIQSTLGQRLMYITQELLEY